MDQTLPISQARNQFPTLVDQVADLSQKVYITVNGQVKAALVNAVDLATMEATIEVLSDPDTMQAIKAGEADLKASDLVDWTEIKQELNLSE